MRGASTAEQFDISTVDGPALTPQISGIFGLCLTSCLWVIASWRLLYHYSGWFNGTYEEEEINHHRTDRISAKRMLHGLLWTASVVEIVAYADMVATNSSNKLNYTLLDIIGRGILEFSTFVTGTLHWFNIISEARAGADERLAVTLFPLILTLATIGVTASSTVEAVALWRGGYESVRDFHVNSDIHATTLIVEAVAYLVHAICVAVCGRMVYKRISSLPTFSQVRSHAKRNIINKMIIPMIFCALSYLLRSGWMAADFANQINNPDTNFESGVGWWVGNCWLPAIIPSIMLLYSIRKRDRVAEPGSGDLKDNLIESPSTEVHANPFQSFQQTFQDFEDEEGSSLTSRK